MMIGPEAYYEIDLKGRSQQEILEEIDSLKQEIHSLQEYLEEYYGEPAKMFPTPLTRLSCYREYLERAIRAYEDAGGKYELTKDEKKSRDFDQALEDVQKLVFSIGGYFSGWETRTCTVSGENVTVEAEPLWLDFSENRRFDTSYTIAKRDFIEGLREIHIGEWKKEYDDPLTLDGTQWELKIEFDGHRKSVEISGSNAYPYNFKELIRLLDMDEKNWE